MFPYGEGIEEKVNKYALKKMTINFQSFKKNLKHDFIKKGLTPDFEKKWQKLCDPWDMLVQHTLLEWNQQ